jgi:plasmid replication initiation protein
MIVPKTTIDRDDRPVLLPERHPNHDLFICDVLDAIPKDDMASMEHPVFTLATKPDTRVLTYEHRNIKIQVTPSVKGLATIFDKDLLIYCISQMISKKNQGKPLSQTVQLQAHDLLVWTNRETSGDAYRRLLEGFERLNGTRIVTNIKADGEEITHGFGLIESYRVVRHTASGRMTELQVRLSDWMFRIIQGSEVLTLSRDYFRLRKPIERRIYEIARKHCGEQDDWQISLSLLHKKVGSTSSERKFRMILRELVENDHLPDYSIQLDGDNVKLRNRDIAPEKPPEIVFPRLNPETYNDAKIVAEGYDVYFLEQEWRDFWVDTGMPFLRDPDKAFVAFCKSRAKRKPLHSRDS